MAEFNPRDKSRTERGKRQSMVSKNTQPPKDQGGWMAISRDLMESPAWRTLSVNARKSLDRLIVEHIGHGRRMNGELIATHDQFIDYGVTCDFVADALEELAYKGLIKMRKGRAGNGTAHPTVYTLTMDGTFDGLPATNEWKKFTQAEAKLWSEVVRKQKAEERAKIGRKRKSSLGNSQVRPLGKSQIRTGS
jgi:uncharacterized protein with NRDE domain